jgi:transposase-like protein
MERAWLERELAAGRSIEAIAREVRRDSSTVAHWVNKHGLASQHAPTHAAEGGVPRERLAALVAHGLTVRELAAQFGVGATTARYWLRKYGLRTQRARDISDDIARQAVIIRRCATHGWTAFVANGSRKHYRCRQCRVERVSARRRRVKALLVAEFGGCCALCGYDRYAGALQFHHLDPAEKSFSLAAVGVARSLEKARAEARKCVLMCANCHAEVEGGIATIPP